MEQIIPQSECIQIMERFPNIELSYEIVPHKKIQTKYNVCLAIPHGRKCYAWFTFYEDRDVCFIMEINRDKKVSRISILPVKFNQKLAFDTVLYGTILDTGIEETPDVKKTIFIIDDILMYQGLNMRDLLLSDRLGFIERTLKNDIYENTYILFACATLWPVDIEHYDCNTYIISKEPAYTVHHIQYRCLNDISPYLNVFNKRIQTQLNKKPQEHNRITGHIQNPSVKRMPNTNQISQTNSGYNKNMTSNQNACISPNINRPIRPDFAKPQYRMATVFLVTADIQCDIYHLFACGKNSSPVYYGVAGIQNYRTSVFMNRIFRRIVENERLDAIEESDDDEEFQNTAYDKYVDLAKTCLIECMFNIKFKKWIPFKVMNDAGCKYVHISKLI